MNKLYFLKSSTILFLIMGICIIYSCSKEKDSNQTPAPGPSSSYPDYGQLKIGNYWIYDNYQDNGTGIFTTYNVFDSCFIDKDTVVQGSKYYRMRKIRIAGSNNYDYSSEYLSDTFVNNRYILYKLFSYQLFTDEIGDNLGGGTYTDTAGNPYLHFANTIVNPDSLITVPAGTFKTLAVEYKTEYVPGPNQDDSLGLSYMHYAKNCGMVFQRDDFYYAHPANYSQHWQKRLIRYHVDL